MRTSLKAIWGFPPRGMQIPQDVIEARDLKITPEDKQGAKELLLEVGARLKIFEHTPNTLVRYIPPVEVSIGIGAIFFENQYLGEKHFFWGISQGLDHWIADTVLGFENFDQVYPFFDNWFSDTLVFKSTDKFILRDYKHIMSSQWKEIMSYFYPDARPRWEELPDSYIK